MTSEIRQYLQEKSRGSKSEWLHREPRTTHPDILDAVRAARAAGLSYDDDIERVVAQAAGDMPDHRRHGHPDRHPLTNQLGHEVYLARGLLRDESDARSKEAALADGFRPISETAIDEGRFYLVRVGVRYGGQCEATYSEPRRLKARHSEGRIVWMPPRARTRGLLISEPALVKTD